MLKRLFSLLFLVVIVLVACSSPSSNGEEEGESGEEIRIGTIYPMTGPLALLGNESFDGIQMVANIVNEQGGVNGKKIQLVKADAPDATAAQNEANRLISREKVPAIIGTYASGLSLAATQVAERNGVLYLETNAVADEITARGFKNVFRTAESASMQALTSGEFAKEVVAP